MDLSRFLPGLAKTPGDDAPLTDDELTELRRERHRLHAPKHGPQRARWITSGQQRRAAVRAHDSHTRKTNKRFRREWMANEAAFYTLRSQLALLVDRPDSALVPGVTKVLVDRYGSVEEATEHYTKLARERIAAAKS